MSVPRKFDWDVARRLREQGLTLKEIARRLGVSKTAIHRVTNPRVRAMMSAQTLERQQGHRCSVCGVVCSWNRSRQEKPRCKACANEAAIRSVRPYELYCSRCGKWKPDQEFPSSKQAKMEVRRFRHRTCRSCNTKVRREYRERHPEEQREYDRAYWHVRQARKTRA